MNNFDLGLSYHTFHDIFTGMLYSPPNRVYSMKYAYGFHLFCFDVAARLLLANWFMSSIYPYHSGLLYWHWGNLMIAPVPVKLSWMIWVKSTTTKPQCNRAKHQSCAYLLTYNACLQYCFTLSCFGYHEMLLVIYIICVDQSHMCFGFNSLPKYGRRE